MRTSVRSNESGMAIITALLVLMLASGLMAGMFAALIADQRSHATDRDQSVAYAAAHAGLEKLTASLAARFAVDFSPSAGDIDVIDNTPPAIPGFEFTSPGSGTGSGYQITYTPDPGPGPNTGNPLAFPNTDITTGPFAGFKGLITPYTLTVTARSTTGASEVRLRRELQTVAVPVFQFGIFGEKSLGFHAGPNFDFGGRVHTNQSLHLAAGTGSRLTFRDKITAFTQVVRERLLNSVQVTQTNHEGTVEIPKQIGGAYPGAYRNLLVTETSGTSQGPCISSGNQMDSRCWTGWKNLSESTGANGYSTNIRTEATGAKQLNLPLATQGAQPIDLIRRPAVNSNEDTANAPVFGQRFFAQASLRILLSDRAEDITNLPTVTGPPVALSRAGLTAAGYVFGAGREVGTSTGENAPEPGILTRVSNVAGSVLTLQTSTNGGTTWGTPTVTQTEWLKWDINNATALPELRLLSTTGTVLNCTGMSSTQLTGCTGSSSSPLPAMSDNAQIWARGAPPEDQWYQIAQANGAHTAKTSGTSNTINIDNVNVANRFVLSRVFFVGEDPVTCTGFTPTTLSGCTWSASATLTANDPVYQGGTMPHTNDAEFLHGFIKIERQNANNTWTDVTMEILGLGFNWVNQEGTICADPTPNAVIRLQRLRDSGGACTYANSVDWHDYWPLTLYDAREGSTRLLATDAGMNVGGLFSYVALDVNNYRRWLAGQIGVSGAQSLNNNGFIVYFSDRRGNHDPLAPNQAETSEYGFEDSINPANAAWAKDNQLNGGEDFNENGTLQSYGETPWTGNSGTMPLVVAGTMAGTGVDANARPWTTIPRLRSGRARLARPVLFRRALKVINGGMVGAVNNIPAAGFTVAAENPVYIQGNFNATTTSVEAEPNVATAMMADSITLLSNSFTDAMTMRAPNDMTNRNATETSYRFAMITGKSVPFNHPGWGVMEWGSDGGVHNFMKMLEDWSGQQLRYRGSMVSLFFSRQATGPYRADANVYSPPTRGYNFDTDFLTPALLPPGTPMFRDINTLKFRQILRPNQ